MKNRSSASYEAYNSLIFKISMQRTIPRPEVNKKTKELLSMQGVRIIDSHCLSFTDSITKDGSLSVLQVCDVEGFPTSTPRI